MSQGKAFQFKLFRVTCNRSAMKLGTDGVLLGAWSRIENCSHILDVGTGCGIITLMAAQRNQVTEIDAIDIDSESVKDAAENFQSSPWADRITLRQADFNAWKGHYDHILSNPPFFTNGLLSPCVSRSRARHTSSLSYEQLLSKSRDLLTDTGRLSFITPLEARSLIYELAAFKSMNIARMCDVIPVAGKQAKRILWELTLGHAALERESLVISNSDHTYTSEYRSLCGDFYLRLD